MSYNTVAFTSRCPNGVDLSQYYIKNCPMNGASMILEDIGTYCDTEEGSGYMRFAHKEAENGDGTKKNDESAVVIVLGAVMILARCTVGIIIIIQNGNIHSDQKAYDATSSEQN